MAEANAPICEKLRLDKWLVYARFVKTRALAGKLATKGKVRINGRKIDKPDAFLRVGDTVTLIISDEVRLIKIEALGTRRGPAIEAQGLYSEIKTELDAF